MAAMSALTAASADQGGITGFLLDLVETVAVLWVVRRAVQERDR